ncbi:flagellin/flagellar hook associated protein [Georhizobium profundi]|uniref:Flagellin n=1 Tax=Georhizobium profundi TaxID=2341112 RepID=A0A3Q8XM87_9HYPH|nr:flagellin [Georhizobium profundi]AZN70819.1 flagellin/flagellar hook associated protein [Georhizobium profundi]
MTSVLTNRAAMAASATLRSIALLSNSTQLQASSGLRIGSASDNAAYWSISTTMKSDAKALGAVGDALGLARAKIDVAYQSLSSVIDVLSEFRAKLVAAQEPGVDPAKIQKELDQLKGQVESIAASSSFNGANWLSTDIDDIHDRTLDVTHVTSTMTRSANGFSALSTMEFHLSETSLFNTSGGGLLEPDSRLSLTLGGIRNSDNYRNQDGEIVIDRFNTLAGERARFKFDFTGPMTFDDPSDAITFDLVVDKDNPSDVAPPHDQGRTTSLRIDRTVVDAVLPSANGTIGTYQDYIRVLNHVLTPAGAYATQVLDYDDDGNIFVVEDAIGLSTSENSGLDGSYLEISGLTAVGVSASGLTDRQVFGTRGSGMTLSFSPFTVHLDGKSDDGVKVSFSFSANGEPQRFYEFDRSYVNALFDRDTGKVETVEEMHELLTSLIAADWPDVLIEVDGASTISIRTDPAVDRLAGGRTRIGFSNIDVSIEPLADLSFRAIDIATNPAMKGIYLNYMDTVLQKAIDGTATLGAFRKRIDMQTDFNASLIQSIEKGVGRLIDADMNDVSTRLKALQVQEQLAGQSLAIANDNTDLVMQLFN